MVTNKQHMINLWNAWGYKFHTNRNGNVIYFIDPPIDSRRPPTLLYLYELDKPKLNMVSAWGKYTPEQALNRFADRKLWASTEKFKAVDQIFDPFKRTWFVFDPHNKIHYVENYPNPRQWAEKGYPRKPANRYVKGPAKSVLELDDKGFVETVITKEGRYKSPVHVVPSGSYVLGSNKKYTPEQVKRKWYNKTMDFI